MMVTAYLYQQLTDTLDHLLYAFCPSVILSYYACYLILQPGLILSYSSWSEKMLHSFRWSDTEALKINDGLSERCRLYKAKKDKEALVALDLEWIGSQCSHPHIYFHRESIFEMPKQSRIENWRCWLMLDSYCDDHKKFIMGWMAASQQHNNTVRLTCKALQGATLMHQGEGWSPSDMLAPCAANSSVLSSFLALNTESQVLHCLPRLFQTEGAA